MYAPDVFLQARHNKLEEKYKLISCIGEGRGCMVYKVENKESGQTYVCKLLMKMEHEPKALLKEIEMLKKLDHPNIVKIFEILEDEEALFLILELCHGGDLCDKICDEGHLSEQVTRVVMRQILDALAYCHAMKVAHRDVKPENFLLVMQDPKCLTLRLTDFGISTAIRPNNMSSSMRSFEWSSFCEAKQEGLGSMPYMAPEVFMHKPSKHGENSLKCDMWSAGVVLYFALSGEFPYGNDPHVTPERICSGKPVEFPDEFFQDVSEDAKDLIRSLLTHDVDERLSAQQALEHRWFRGDGAAFEEPYELPGGADSREASIEGSPRKAALFLLQSLRCWRKKMPLLRWAIAAMAGQLPEDCETQRLAKTIYKMFSDGSGALKNERLVDALVDAQAEAAANHISDAVSVTSTKSSGRSWKSMLQEGELSGKEIKRKIHNDMTSVFKRLASVSETPTCEESPRSESPSSSSHYDTMEEISDLVGSLDGKKSGKVQYTLLVAALLPEHVYCDDLRISEVFQVFDVRKRGRIRPQDLRVALQCPRGHKGHFSQMVQKCDRDGDGAIDLAEFRAMVRGEIGSQSQTPAGITPPNKTPSERAGFWGRLGQGTARNVSLVTL
jgi:serine/threonine protein kinase